MLTEEMLKEIIYSYKSNKIYIFLTVHKHTMYLNKYLKSFKVK